MLKIDMVNKLLALVKTVDEDAFLESEHNIYYIVNKDPLFNLSPEKLAKRSSKEGLEFMLNLYSKYQKEVN